MKYLLRVYIENVDHAFALLRDIREHGYNGIVFNTSSLKHKLEDSENDEYLFFNLEHLSHHHNLVETTFCYFIVDEEKLGDLKNLVREGTKNFTDIKGGMYSTPLQDYEGSL